jgi:hypothetical protein
LTLKSTNFAAEGRNGLGYAELLPHSASLYAGYVYGIGWNTGKSAKAIQFFVQD